MLNQVVLMGRLTRNPELRHTQSDVPVANFSLAVDRGFRAADGQQTVDFVPIVAWRGTAEFVSKYFKKGQLVAVSGRIQVRTWVTDGGENRTSTEVVANEVFFAEGKRDNQQTDAEPVALPFPISNPDLSAEDFEEITFVDDGEILF